MNDRWRWLVGLLCLASAAGSGQAPATVLETGALRLEVRGSRVVSLFDKSRGIEHVVRPAAAVPGVLRLELVRGVNAAATVDLASAGLQSAEVNDRRLALSYDHPQVAIQLAVESVAQPHELVWSATVRPKDPELAVSRVDFPLLATPRLHDGQEKRYLFPMFEGKWPRLSDRSSWRAHPAELFSQLVGCTSPAGGFVLWTDDGDGHQKDFGYDLGEDHATFAVRHRPAFAPGLAWRSPYRVRLTLCDGTWQSAAEPYRTWANAQPWSATPLRERRGMAELLRHPPICISSQLDREDLTTLPARLQAWGQRFGAPVIYRPLGWEQHGNWVGIDYFPPSLGAEAFRSLCEKLRERGIVVAGFISGYVWTTAQDGPLGERSNAALERYFQEMGGGSSCERGRDGSLLARKSEVRATHRICRGTPVGQTFLQQTAKQLFDLGVTVIHDDQDHGPSPNGLESCFDASHGHPVPSGPWSTDVTRAALRAIRAEADARGLTGFFLTKESCTDLLNLELDAYQARFFHESATPDLVPLAQYLFHDRIPVIFGWVTAPSRSAWELAAGLVYGQIPSLAYWGASAQTPAELPATSAALLEDYYAAMAGHAKPFLLSGRMLPPLVIDGPTEQREAPQRQAGRPARRRTVTVPLVIHSAWDDGGGNVGVYAVNTMREDVAVRVAAPGAGDWQAARFVGAAAAGDALWPAGDPLVWRLPPGRLCSLTLRRRP